MKLYIFSCFALFVFLQPLQAQLSVDVSLGGNLTHYRMNNAYGNNFTTTANHFLGLAPNIVVADRVSLLANFNYLQSGYLLENQGGITGSHLRTQFTYLEFNPEVEYQVFQNVFFALGATVGLKLQEKFRIGDRDWEIPQGFEMLNNDEDFGVTSKIKFAHRNFFCFARFNLGLSNVASWQVVDENAQPAGNTTIRRSSLLMGVGYRIGS